VITKAATENQNPPIVASCSEGTNIVMALITYLEMMVYWVGVDLLTAWGGKEKRERKRRKENSAPTARLSRLLLSFSSEQRHYHHLRLRGGSFPKEVSGRPTVPGARVRLTTAFTI
jgi:hypothetical protein